MLRFATWREKMTIYYQHIGEVLWARDAPRSIGTPKRGVVRLHLSDIDRFLAQLEPFEMLSIRSKIVDLAPTGFQVWEYRKGPATFSQI